MQGLRLPAAKDSGCTTKGRTPRIQPIRDFIGGLVDLLAADLDHIALDVIDPRYAELSQTKSLF
jgi:uncharacterized protein (DUF779 family)